MRIDCSMYEEMLGERIDYALSDYLEDLSRSKITKAIKENAIQVNQKPVKPSYLLKEEDIIEIDISFFKQKEILPENIPLSIIYEDEDILVLNKETGLLVHPTNTVRSGTLVNALLYHTKSLSRIGGDERPGIVHRLDQETSGILIIAKNDPSHLRLQEQFKNRTVEKRYLAILHGKLEVKDFLVEELIGRNMNNRKLMSVDPKGKYAKTIYNTVDCNQDYSLADIEIITGRTHQIRVHSAYIHHPVLGDSLYGRKNEKVKTDHHMLHARSIHFLHPSTGKDLYFEADLTKNFEECLVKTKLSLL